jgi:hypothetical protein
MPQQEFITIENKHVGKKVFRAFGRRWRIGFRIRPEDIGRRVYRIEAGIELRDALVTSDSDFTRLEADISCGTLEGNQDKPPMTKTADFITLERQHVGESIVKAFGEQWCIGRPIRQRDVGKRLYHTDDDNIEIEPSEGAPAYPDVHLHIFEICKSLRLSLLREISDDTYALGQSQPDGEVTPWFDTVDELEQFCEENIHVFRQQAKVKQS